MKCSICGLDANLIGGKIWRCDKCGSVMEEVSTDSNRARAYSLGAEEQPEPPLPEDGQEERCPVCGHTLLGIWHKGVLQIRHQGREWWIAGGTIGVKCSPRCGYVLSIDTIRYEVNIVSSFDDVINSVANATDPAKALANKNNIVLSNVEATGKSGRIVKRDVEEYLERLVDIATDDEGSE